MPHHTEEFTATGVTIRVDLMGARGMEQLLEDTTFLDYRLAAVERRVGATRPAPDLVWDWNGSSKSAAWDGRQVQLTGEWEEGELQKVLVSLLARRMEEAGLYLFHTSAVQYRDRTVLFMTGEGNSGKTMSQLEACRRGGAVVATETLVVDTEGAIRAGSRNIFLRKRTRGTERSDKPSQDQGIAKLLGGLPDLPIHEGAARVDLVVMPDIDGNFDPVTMELGGFEREYQTFHSLINFMGLNLLLAPGVPMPLLDTPELRARRAAFISDFCRRRPFYLVRAPHPSHVLDAVDGVLDGEV